MVASGGRGGAPEVVAAADAASAGACARALATGRETAAGYGRLSKKKPKSTHESRSKRRQSLFPTQLRFSPRIGKAGKLVTRTGGLIRVGAYLAVISSA